MENALYLRVAIGSDKLPVKNRDTNLGKISRLVPKSLEVESTNNNQWFSRLGLVTKTVTRFGLRVAEEGPLARRIIAPVTDLDGRLVAYIAVNPGGSLSEERKGRCDPLLGSVVRDTCDPTVLYNRNRVQQLCTELLIVQDFTDVWSLWQDGYHNVVGLFDNTCSVAQGQQVIDALDDSGRAWIITDDSEMGALCARQFFRSVGPFRSCRWISVPVIHGFRGLADTRLSTQIAEVGVPCTF